MKKLLSLPLLCLILHVSVAQGTDEALAAPTLFLQFDFMKVSSANMTDYLAVEDFWSGIHQQRADRGDIIGWDLWTLAPAGQSQGSQYLTVQLYDSFDKLISGMNMDQLMADAKKAYPDKSDDEINDMMNKTGKAREINNQLMLERIDGTEGQFDMPLGTVCTMAIMLELDEGYEAAESEVFKPMHQSQVDNGEKGDWSMARIIFPAGSDRYASHLVFNMFKDAAQFAKARETAMPELDEKTQEAVMAGLETRDMKQVKMLTLIRKVR